MASHQPAPRPFFRLRACAFVFLATLAVGGASVASAQAGRGLGLSFASPEQLQGVPLAPTPFSGEELPPSVDLTSRLPPPGNQGAQNSCVGWACAYYLKSLQESTEENRANANGGRIDTQRVFSPAFIYNQINNGRDGGSLFIDALNLLSSYGVAPLALMPYSDRDFTTRPNAQALAAAKRYRIDFWRRVNVADNREVKAQLNAGYPVLIGAEVDEHFRSLQRGEVWSAYQGPKLGGHAMLIVGYDDRRNAFRLVNSWGQDWCEGGYGWISYDHFRSAVREAYVAKDALNGPAPEPTDTRTNPPPDNRPPVVTPNPNPTNPTPWNPNIPPPPQRDAQVVFQIYNVQHNVTGAPPYTELGMSISGWLYVPPGIGRNTQVVVHFFFNNNGGKGQAIYSRGSPFIDVYNLVATGTAQMPVPGYGMNIPWTVWVPYGVFWLPPGTGVRQQGPYGPVEVKYLVAEPVLYLDGFGVRVGPLLPFTITN